MIEYLSLRPSPGVASSKFQPQHGHIAHRTSCCQRGYSSHRASGGISLTAAGTAGFLCGRWRGAKKSRKAISSTGFASGTVAVGVCLQGMRLLRGPCDVVGLRAMVMSATFELSSLVSREQMSLHAQPFLQILERRAGDGGQGILTCTT